MSLQPQDLNELLQQWTKNLEEAYQVKRDREFCDHEFQEYIGFTERYYFCRKCDAKSQDGIWISERP